MIIDQYKKMKNLFLRQSYIDAWEDYQRSIRKRSFAQWDYIVLTASNDKKHKGAIVAVIMTLLLNPSIGFSVVYGSCFLLPAFDKVYEIKT